MRLIIIRAGSARLVGPNGIQHVNVGDVVLITANTLCEAQPEEMVTTTTLYLDCDYLLDQTFWQRSDWFSIRLDARDYLYRTHTAPIEVVRIGEQRVGLLAPWADKLAALCLDGPRPERFFHAQALLFSILDVITPYLGIPSHRSAAAHRTTTVPSPPRHRSFGPVRPEARQAADLLRCDSGRRWTIAELADAVHLSPSQLNRVFVAAYGKSPIAYLTLLRAECMALMLVRTNLSIRSVAIEAGWRDPDFAAQQFRRRYGITPSRYRSLSREHIDLA